MPDISALAFMALGHHFAVRTDDPSLLRYLERLLAPLRVPEQAVRSYDVTGPTPRGRASLRYDGATLLADATPPHLVATLLWHVNQEVLARSGDAVLLHAAAAERDGAAVLLPGRSGSGKTTLVAGLLRAGLRYLTDEAVAVDPDTLAVKPFHKPLSVDPGSFEVLADLRPPADEAPPWTEGGPQWHVPAAAFGPDRLAPVASPALVVSPRHEPGAAVTVEALTPGETLLLLADNTFAFAAAPRRNLGALAAVAESAPGYRLVGGDLDECVAAVLDLAGAAAAAR